MRFSLLFHFTKLFYFVFPSNNAIESNPRWPSQQYRAYPSTIVARSTQSWTSNYDLHYESYYEAHVLFSSISRSVNNKSSKLCFIIHSFHRNFPGGFHFCHIIFLVTSGKTLMSYNLFHQPVLKKLNQFSSCYFAR